jgi:hypothetical protein
VRPGGQLLGRTSPNRAACGGLRLESNWLIVPLDKLKFDVAISFLVQDEPIAAALHHELSQTLNVFFFPHKQEDLAGTDGMESMRQPFLEDCRVMVVLYREQWGKTRWTAIEETAIKEACFNGEWKRLFFIALDRHSALPKWLPEYHVRYNWEDFGLDQAVGAIKARVLDTGGQPAAPTPLKRAELLKDDDEYRLDKSRMNSSEGIAKILESLQALFAELQKQCEAVIAHGHLQIRYEIDSQPRNTHHSCVMTDGNVGMIVIWHQQFSNTLDDSGLHIQQYNGGLILNSEMGRRVHLRKPDLLTEDRYEPELSRAREYGWTSEDGEGQFISSSALASRCVVKFLDLVDAFASGKIERRW